MATGGESQETRPQSTQSLVQAALARTNEGKTSLFFYVRHCFQSFRQSAYYCTWSVFQNIVRPWGYPTTLFVAQPVPTPTLSTSTTCFQLLYSGESPQRYCTPIALLSVSRLSRHGLVLLFPLPTILLSHSMHFAHSLSQNIWTRCSPLRYYQTPTVRSYRCCLGFRCPDIYRGVHFVLGIDDLVLPVLFPRCRLPVFTFSYLTFAGS